jgi:hypothetical protein
MNENNIKPVPATPAVTPRVRTLSQSAFATSLRDRPVVFNSKHIDDFGRKRSVDISNRKDLRFDEGSLQLTNDPNSIIYRRLSETLGQRVAKETHLTEEEEKLKHFEKYGPKLVEFVKDKDGHLKSKFDKAFIT